MYVVLIGRPGSGKGTQSKRLQKRLGIPHLSTGEMLRAAQRSDPVLAGKVERINQGDLASDDLIIDLVASKLSSNGDAGCLFDGFPRTLPQAIALDGLLTGLGDELDLVIELEVSEDELFDRLKKRAEVDHRPDDTPEALTNRLKVFEKQTAPVIDYYRANGVLRTIDGTGAPDEVFDRIKTCVDVA